MTDPAEIRKRNHELRILAEKKFSVEVDSLEAALKKAGRRLPRKVRKKAVTLVEADKLAGHPKLAMMLDAQRIEEAQIELREALEAIDPADRRKGLVLSTLGMVSFNLLVVFVVFVAVLIWRGFL